MLKIIIFFTQVNFYVPILISLLTYAKGIKPICDRDGCPWDKLAFNCGKTSFLNVDYSAIQIYSGAVLCGNLFLEQDIGGHTLPLHIAPIVTFPAASDTALYSLIMVDPDSFANGSWPFVTAPGPYAPVRHWVMV